MAGYPVHARDRMLRFQAGGLAVGSDALTSISPDYENVTKAAVSFGRVWFEPDKLLAGGEGAVELILRIRCVNKAGVARFLVRLQIDGLAICHNGLFALALTTEA